MRKINVLDESTISKIAAGEIIEDPASVVKELLENSIDAGSKDISVEIRGNAGDYIKVKDNGSGIGKEDLEFAFLHHSTSKLKSDRDIFSVMTLGFRGEALASIAHVSKVEIVTRTEGDVTATRAFLENGQIVQREETAAEVGTTIVVRNLFYNVPVRKKYLKSDKREFAKVQDIVEKIALSRPDISIKLISDGKVILFKNNNLDERNTIYTILGREIAENMIYIESDGNTANYTLSGYISNNKLFRSTRNYQYLFVNGRSVKNLDISKEIEKQYYTLIPLNRYPVFILNIEVDPKLVDVNIHPKKNEIKLSNESDILNTIGDIVSQTLNPNREFAKVKENKEAENLTVFQIYSEDKIEKVTPDEELKREYRDDPTEVSAVFEPEEKYSKNIEESFDTPETNSESNFENNTNGIDEFFKIENGNFIGILFRTYILIENPYEEKVFVIDQHAAHERVLFEKFKYEFENEEVVSQILLMPQTLDLSPNEMANTVTNKDLLKKFGFAVEEFGNDKIVIREVPMMFDAPVSINFIRDIIENLDEIDSKYESNIYKVMKKACKAAVKGGDSISKREVDALISDLKKCEIPFTCPHGRPTIVEVSKDELEKLFLRQ